MDETESRTPLTAAPQVQYFDVSDVESTSSEEAGPATQPGQGSDDDDGELEVFVAEQTKSAVPEPKTDPFGVEAMESERAAAGPPPPAAALPVATFFEGQGIKPATAKAAEDYDDEFDYAFEGKAREGETHRQVFTADSIPVPKGLLTDVKRGQLLSLCEEEEEEEDHPEEGGMPSNALPEESGEAGESDWESATLKVQEELTEGALEARPVPKPAMQGFEVEAAGDSPSWTPPQNDAALMAVFAARTQKDSALLVELDDIDLLGEDGATPTRHEASFEVTPSPAMQPAREDLDAQWAAASEEALASKWSTEDSTNRSPKKKQRSLINTQKALKFFGALDVGQYLPEIVEQDGNGAAGPAWLNRLLCGMLGPPQLNSPTMAEERRRVFCYAKIPFNDSEGMHFRILSSIYVRFVSGPSPGRYGAHWADIGFQGNDPATDLRGCGMLGLVQLLHLWDADSGNAAAIYRLSRHEVQEFPLAVVAMNITKWSLQALRAGRLNGAANSKASVLTAVMQFYVGVFYHFFDTWQERGATMSESGYVLKEVENHCRKRPADMMKLAESAHLENRA